VLLLTIILGATFSKPPVLLPVERNPAKSGTILRILSRPGREEMAKDGLKMGCEKGKLFLSEPLAYEDG
jgi:hypothetical protein